MRNQHRILAQSLPIIGMLLLVACSEIWAEDALRPRAQEALEPIMREVHIPVDDEKVAGPKNEKKIAIEDLTGDLTALRQAVERARKIISEGKIENLDIGWIDDPQYNKKQAGVGRQKKGDIVISKRLEPNHLEIQPYADESYDVSARVRNGQLVNVYSELLYLIGRGWDDQQVLNRNQLIHVHISNMPWQQALTVILGQGGLSWREEEIKGRKKIVVYPVRNHPRIKEDLHNLALDAWDKAAKNRQNGIAAQALYQRARQYFEAEQYSGAIRTFFDVSDTFREQAEKDAHVRHWVKQAQLGIGDTMMALKQYREARAVYLNYLSLSLENEDISSDVYIKAARASQLYGKEMEDVIASEKAEDILDNMLLKYRNDKRAANNIVRANYMLGVLMMEKKEYRAAKKYFKAFRDQEGGNHRLDSYLADCEYELAKELKSSGDYKMADQYYGSAQALYKSIATDYRNNRADPLIKEVVTHVYQNAFFRIGECYLSYQRPAFPEALVSFLTAREQFPDSDLDGQVLVKIAHCFARLHADEHAIAHIQQMLGSRGLEDEHVSARINDLLSDIQNGLGEYDGKIKAKALFYIAQGKYQIAKRNRYDINKIDEVIRYYRRVITNDPGPELRDASRLGIARAALLAKDYEQAESQLQELLRDSRVSQRDRSYAGQLLGRHYREQGKFREAIEAFQGSATE